MSRLHWQGRSLARLAIGLVALGAPFLGAQIAQGALGTSQTLSLASINRPVLTSVTATGDTGLVSYCFATPNGLAVTGPYATTDFWLGGYDDSFRQNAATISQESNNCVQATFAQGQRTQYTYGGVESDAVAVIVGGSPIGNEADGAPLNGSVSHNGTRGLSTGPDLQTVLRPGTNRMTFSFDQNVNEDALCASPPCPTRSFQFYSQDGNTHGATTGVFGPGGAAIVAVSDNLVTVQYDATAGDAVNDATIAVIASRARTCETVICNTGGALRSDTPFGGSNRNFPLSVAVPGSSGNTDLLDLVGGTADTRLTANGNSNQITYRFDGNVALGEAGLDRPEICFSADLSNAKDEFATGAATGPGTNEITATFARGDGLQQFSEMVVAATVTGGPPCVRSTTGQVANTTGGKPVGDNQDAFALGYTDGPDALGLSRSGGDMRVRVDQRVKPSEINTGCVNLVNAQGAPFGPSPNSASVLGNGSPFDTHVVVFSFDPDAAAQASGLQLLGYQQGCPALGTFEGDSGFDNPEFNASQVFGFGGLTG
jgi:hypothetical protein